MPRYRFVCDTCGHEEALTFRMGECPREIGCDFCAETMTRRYESPQLVTQPDRLREENKYWWVKDGETYSMTDKLEQDRADDRKWDADQARYEENRKREAREAAEQAKRIEEKFRAGLDSGESN